jgi:hypothetical protein
LTLLQHTNKAADKKKGAMQPKNQISVKINHEQKTPTTYRTELVHHLLFFRMGTKQLHQ